jgi:tRNA-dihydrouridine synthase A
MKREFPMLPIIANGGFKDASATREALTWCDGVMLGREAYHRPMLLAELDRVLSHDESTRGASDDRATMHAAAMTTGHVGNDAASLRESMLDRMAHYAAREMARGERLSSITRHMLGLYAGEPGARDYRRTLSEGARAADATADLIRRAAPSRAAA